MGSQQTYLLARLATVWSGPDRSLFWRPLERAGPHGPENWDRSLVPKCTVQSQFYGPVSSMEMETVKKTGLYGLASPDRSPAQSLENWDRTVCSSLRPDCKSGNCNSERFGAYERY